MNELANWHAAPEAVQQFFEHARAQREASGMQAVVEYQQEDTTINEYQRMSLPGERVLRSGGDLPVINLHSPQETLQEPHLCLVVQDTGTSYGSISFRRFCINVRINFQICS